MSKIFMKSSWGSDDPTRAAMVFAHGAALAKAGNDVRIFLVGEAAHLGRSAVRETVIPIGWPPVATHWAECQDLHISIEVCGACSAARGISPDEIAAAGATVGSPATFVANVEWSDKIICE
jgi:predicted peroxiredoxin